MYIYVYIYTDCIAAVSSHITLLTKSIYTYECGCGSWMWFAHMSVDVVWSQYIIDKVNLQPIAKRMAKNLEIISKNFQISTRRTRILMGFVVDWFSNPIFRTNSDVRDVDKLSWDLEIILGPHWGKCTILVQSAHLPFS